MKTMLKYLFFSYLLFICGQGLGQNVDFRIAPIPEWVKQQNLVLEIPEKNKSSSSSHHLLLLSRQENITNKQKFLHSSIKILNSEGLQKVSDLSMDFDPSYQELVFHKLDVIRGTKVTNHLTELPIKIVQRETNLERHIYDERLTAIINLKDMRVGDIIDYSYSIIGYNPVFEGLYSAKLYQQYSVPIEHIYIRLIVPKGKKLQFKYNDEAYKPKQYPSSIGEIYVWEQKNVPNILYDINTPVWHNPYPQLSISEYPSWKSIVDWSKDLFSINEPEKNQLKESVESFFNHQSIDSTILRAIRFVQDDIRYLGFVNGLNSHKPHSPTEVLAQRYGDCKDKSFLLSEILKLYGIDSSPVLVHSYNGLSIENDLPFPNVFDHCVVQFKKNGNTYYVDPTFSNQGGDLENFYFPNYHKGLIIKEGINSLVDLPLSDNVGMKVKEIFTIEDVGKGGDIHIETTFAGLDADYQREYFANSGLESIQKARIDFYSRLYPQIRVNEELKFTDPRGGKNSLTIDEFYSVDSLWDNSQENEQLLFIEFYPLLLHDYILVPQSPTRSMPYLINYPNEIEYETVIKLPEEWVVEDDSMTIKTESFEYNYSVIYDHSVIRIVHKYKTLQEYIKADQADIFIEKHKNIAENLSFILTYNKDFVDEQFKLSWSALIFALIILFLSVYWAVRIFKSYDIPVSFDPDIQKQIGGWLILVAIGLTFTPLRIGYDLLTLTEYFNSNVWGALIDFNASARIMLTGLLMIVEMLYNFMYFVFSVLTVALFYSKRTILPRVAIILYSASLFFLIIDTLFAFSINPDLYSAIDKQSSYKEIALAFIAAVIWIPYFIYSKRVKQTFVNRSQKNKNTVETESLNKAKKNVINPTVIRNGKFVFLIIVVIIVFGYVFKNYNDSQKINQFTSQIRKNGLELPGTESSPYLSFKIKENSDWKYAILKCESKRDDMVHIRIITVNEYSGAKEILSRLKDGVSFIEIASMESNHPTKTEGGSMGTFNVNDLNEKFQVALIGIQEGEYTDIIELDTN